MQDAADRFRALACRLAEEPAARVDLCEAALCIAAAFQPELDPEPTRARLEALRAGAASRLEELGESDGDRERAQALLAYLSGECGLHGNHESYYDPRNSYLDQVLERGVGIPITLSLVYLDLARSLALPLHGVSFPGHFLLRWTGKEDLVLDAFDGRLLSDDECASLHARAVGEDQDFDREAQLRPADDREIVTRLLANLRAIFVREERWDAALLCIEWTLWLHPDHAGELRDRGLVYERLECWGAALADLERFVEMAPGDPSAEAVRARLAPLRRRASRLH